MMMMLVSLLPLTNIAGASAHALARALRPLIGEPYA